MAYLDELFSLEGSVAAVVGGSGVLGGEMAKTLAKAGAKTAIFYSGNRDGAEKHASEIVAGGGEAMTARADVGDEDSLQEAFGEITKKWGGLDILINAPGINSTTPVMELTDEEWNQIMDVNLKGAFLSSRLAARQMISQGREGSIINISSVSSEIPLSKVFTYSISKSGMNNMTRFLAREWAPNKIRVNAIMPGFFPAEQNRKILTKERRDSIFGHMPMQRYGDPDELSGAVVWLASNRASSYVTGALIAVDGGFTAMSI